MILKPISDFQGKIKGYPVWSDPNRVEPFLNENASPPQASPSIVNAKALSKFIHVIFVHNILALLFAEY